MPFGPVGEELEPDRNAFWESILNADSFDSTIGHARLNPTASMPELRLPSAFGLPETYGSRSFGERDGSETIEGADSFSSSTSINHTPVPIVHATLTQDVCGPSRIVVIEKLPLEATAETIGHIASMYGTVRRLYKPRQWPGTAIVVFFDIRHAESCCTRFGEHWRNVIGTSDLSDFVVQVSYGSKSLLANFAKADPDEVPLIMENEGVLYVHEDPNIPIRLQSVLAEMGEMRGFVRDAERYGLWTMVDFYDTRAADSCRVYFTRLGIKTSFKPPVLTEKMAATVANPFASNTFGAERPQLRHSISFSDGFTSINQQRTGSSRARDLQRAVFERKMSHDSQALGLRGLGLQSPAGHGFPGPSNEFHAALGAAHPGLERSNSYSGFQQPIAPPRTLERSNSYSGDLGSFRSATGMQLGIQGAAGSPTDSFGDHLADPFQSLSKFLGPDVDPRKLKAPPNAFGTATGQQTYPVMQGRQSQSRSPPSRGCAENHSVLPRTIPVSNVVDLWSLASGREKRTTIMIRNIPNKYSQAQFLDLLNETHYGEYSFVYLRIDYVNKCNVGYCFVDFPDPSSIVSFAHRIVGKKWPLYQSDKLATVSWANVQGKQNLVEKFKNSSVMQEDIPADFKPKIFFTEGPLRGQEEPFPGPSTPIMSYPHRTLALSSPTELDEDEYEAAFTNHLRLGE
ncbi:RNA recognition motif 2-domain-containing protein [Hyaloraphidium curvatum]|nr:RNA recognition motif 2-domain-containing protein [Hyaloraphidium curvatum]